MRNSVKIGKKWVGSGHPCFIVAEVGANHNGDLDTAKRLIQKAAEAGVDAAKFQTVIADKHYSKNTPRFSCLENFGPLGTQELIRKYCEYPFEWHSILKKCAEEYGVEFFTSVFYQDAICELEALDVPAYKIASFEIVDLGLISEAAKTGKPIILSTGMATWEDIADAILVCKQETNENVIVLQCTSAYPTPPERVNLLAIRSLAERFNVVTGLSDHTVGIHVPVTAIAFGARMIEKHFTMDRRQTGPDHPFSIEPDELSRMVKQIRDVESAIGDGSKNGPYPEELEMFEKGRRSIHARVCIPKGTVIRKDMLCVKRPGYGIAPKYLDEIVGLTAKNDIDEDRWITYDMLFLK